MRTFIMTAAMMAAVAAPMQAQDAFDTRAIRGEGTVMAVSMIAGDWLVNNAFTQEMYGVAVERGMAGAHFAWGNVLAAGDPHRAMSGGVDFAVAVPRVPLDLTVGAGFAQAQVAEDVTLREFGAPIHLSSSTVLVFDSFWVHPLLAIGAIVHRTEFDETTTGVKQYAATGLEIGRGPASLRAHLEHNISAPQQANLALRFRF
ncbi:MAG TPA: hypothetical protein VK929_03585 [Longimicrobiales bacterium]|nr:hypothetical protein [Longimicrobiales bacterium]